jgi:2-oxoglutarate dehydrogenase E1 component
MADDAGRLNELLAETSFLYGVNAGFVEDLYGKWAADPYSVEPSWRGFFASLADGVERVRQASEPPSWTPQAAPEARPEWLSAIDGVWPPVESKLETRIAAATPAPAPAPDEVRARTLDS